MWDTCDSSLGGYFTHTAVARYAIYTIAAQVHDTVAAVHPGTEREV